MNEQSPPKKLTRSRNDRYIGGVAAGIATRFDIDPIFVRIAFLVSLAFGGLGLLAYVVMLAVMPVEGDPSEPLPPIEPKRRNLMIGVAAAVGVFALFTADSGGFAAWIFGFWPGTVFGVLFWTAAGVALVWLIAAGTFNRDKSDGTTEAPAPSPSPQPAAPAEPEPEPDAPAGPVTYAASPTQLPETEAMPTREMGPAGAGEAPVRDDAPSTIGKIMVWFAIGITALIVFCVLFVFSAGATALLGGVPMAALVIVLGAGMVFAGLRGRRQLSLWLLAAAIAITIPMAAVSIADLRIEGEYGEIKETPLSVLDIPEDGYEMAAGSTTIDLRMLDFESAPVDLKVKSGMGLTSVIVPDHLCVVGGVNGKAGVITFRGSQRNGIDVDLLAPTYVKPVTGGDLPMLRLDGNFKLGAFEVVDGTEWQQVGRGGSFDHEGSAMALQAQQRARAACSFGHPLKPSGDKGAGKLKVN